MLNRYFPQLLTTIFVLFFIALGIDPVAREVWIAEVIPVLLVLAILVLTFSKFRFSNLSYALLAFWMFWHTIGGHYTFANVPFGFVTDLFGFERNHFDRISHFSIGFYAYPLMELATRKHWCNAVLASFFGVFFVMSIAAGYEIIEWWYAVAQGGESGIEFLGSQGDIWDAQKDMLADTLGALSVTALFWMVRPDHAASNPGAE